MLGREVIPELHVAPPSTVAQAAFQLRVENYVFDGLKNDLDQANHPETLGFQHDAVHHAHTDGPAGHFGQGAQRHVVLEHHVQVGLAFFVAGGQQRMQHQPDQPAQRAAAVVQLAQGHVAVDFYGVVRDGAAQQDLPLGVGHVLHLAACVVRQVLALVGVGCTSTGHSNNSGQEDVLAGGTDADFIAAALDLPGIGVITSRAVSNGTNIMSVLVKLTNKRDCKV